MPRYGIVVAWGGIEPPTQGFSIRAMDQHCSRFIKKIKHLHDFGEHWIGIAQLCG
jgi:hypothetical protein